MITETDGLNAYEFGNYFVIIYDFKFSSRENKDLTTQIKKLGEKNAKEALVIIVKIIINFLNKRN